jgi:hypothetical protein
MKLTLIYCLKKYKPLANLPRASRWRSHSALVAGEKFLPEQIKKPSPEGEGEREQRNARQAHITVGERESAPKTGALGTAS